MTRTLKLAPTWTAAMPTLLAAIENGADEGKRAAREVLMRLASIADAAAAGGPSVAEDGKKPFTVVASVWETQENIVEHVTAQDANSAVDALWARRTDLANEPTSVVAVFAGHLMDQGAGS